MLLRIGSKCVIVVNCQEIREELLQQFEQSQARSMDGGCFLHPYTLRRTPEMDE